MVRQLLLAGLAIALGGLLLALGAQRRWRPSWLPDDDEFPALAFASALALHLDHSDVPFKLGGRGTPWPPPPSRARADSEPALGMDPWTARTAAGRDPGSHVQTGTGQRPRERRPHLGADRLAWAETGRDAERIADGHQRPVVFGEVSLVPAFGLRRQDRLAPVFVKAGVDPP